MIKLAHLTQPYVHHRINNPDCNLMLSPKLTKKDDYFNTEHLKSGLKGKAMRSAGVTIFANILSFFIHIFSTVILARLLTPNDYGLITMVTTFSLLLQNFGGNGFTEAIIQRQDLNHKTMSTLFWTNAAIMAGLSILFMLMAPLLVWFYKEPLLFAITIAVAISILFGGMATMHMAILLRNMEFYKTSIISILAIILSITTAIIMAWYGLGYWALIANTLMLPLVTSVCAWVTCRWRPGKPGPAKDIQPMIKFAIHTYGNFALNYFTRNVDKMLTGWKYGAESLGHYKKAYDLFTLPANQLLSPISNVALATLSRLTNEPEKYRRYYLGAITIIAFIGMPISAILTLTGYDIILLVLGPQWTKAGEIFCYFGTSIGIMLITFTQGWLHLSLGKPERWIRWSIFQTLVTTSFFIVGLRFGIGGIAIAYSLAFYILFLPCLWYAGKPIQLSVFSVISAIWRYFSAALIAGLLSYAILYIFDSVHLTFINLNVFFRIISASILCALLYLIMIILLFQSLNPIKNFITTAREMLPHKLP